MADLMALADQEVPAAWEVLRAWVALEAEVAWVEVAPCQDGRPIPEAEAATAAASTEEEEEGGLHASHQGEGETLLVVREGAEASNPHGIPVDPEEGAEQGGIRLPWHPVGEASAASGALASHP